jgi:hypothetical protein
MFSVVAFRYEWWLYLAVGLESSLVWKFGTDYLEELVHS